MQIEAERKGDSAGANSVHLHQENITMRSDKKDNRLGDLECSVMEHVWNNPNCTADHAVRQRQPNGH